MVWFDLQDTTPESYGSLFGQSMASLLVMDPSELIMLHNGWFQFGVRGCADSDLL